MERRIKAQLYHNFLAEEGYRPVIDKDGDVTFKVEGRIYFIQIFEDDDLFFRVCFPNFWEIESDEERQKVLKASNIATRTSKVAKIFTVEDNVWASVELFIGDPDAFKLVFARCLSALQNCVRSFTEKMRENVELTSEVE